MYAFVGVGQGGSSIADLAASKKIPALSINYSRKDLDSCVYINKQKQLHLSGSEGVGRNRDHAKSLFDLNYEKTISFIKLHLEQPSIEVIFIAYATSGGTGSGLAPIIADLIHSEMPEKAIVACPILPDSTEYLTNQVNALSCIKETLKSEVAVLMIDNAKFDQPSLHKSEKYQQINTRVINQLMFLLSCTEKESKISNLDSKDLKSIFHTPGLLAIGDLQLTDDDDENQQWLAKALQNSLSSSSYSASIDHGGVIKAGLLVNGTADLFRKATMSNILSKFNNSPSHLFEGFYESKQRRVVSILSGLSPDVERIRSLKNAIEEMQKIEESSYDYHGVFEVEAPISHSSKDTNKNKVSPLEILNKYK
ncbi:hypothetical protein [Bacillus sp. Marseille-P3800]|uniref:hypothetical protein n=1 Tax=Bacillus sp. Marseille-P3800 TaxID=2014782 RepID=UPI000C089EC8|nr:hypothetical protein [Bacillus sp. Marseille-P3800]